MVRGRLIFPRKACRALLRVSGAFPREQQTLLVTLPATYKPLYTAGKALLILYRKPRFHLCTWLYTDSETFHTRLSALCTKRAFEHTHTHTLSRVLFLQAVAPLILSDLKFVCSSLQRAPSMIPGSPRAPPPTPLYHHLSTFISLTSLSQTLLRLEQLPDCPTHTRANIKPPSDD